MPTVFTEAMNLGDLLKFEAPNLYSRDRVTVAAGQNLPLGTVLGIVTASGKLGLLGTNEATRSFQTMVMFERLLSCAEAITAAEKASAIAQLKALGVLVRQGV